MNHRSEAPKPPHLAAWLLSLFARSDEKRTIIGDLDEYYGFLLPDLGPFRAGLWYWLQTGRSLPPLISHSLYWSWVMLENYLKVAVRNLRKRPVYAFINVFGLAVGSATCLLMLAYLQSQFSYDAFHEKADRIYRVSYHTSAGGVHESKAITPFPWGPALGQAFPELEHVVRLSKINRVVEREQHKFKERFFYADSSFFEVFTFPLQKGDPNTALSAPNSIVLTQQMAQKYFGTEDPIGQTLNITGKWLAPERTRQYQITGVMWDYPPTSHFYPNFVASISSLDDSRDDARMGNWISPSPYTYVVLREGHDPSALEEKLSGFLADNVDDAGLQRLGIAAGLQPITDIHLHSHLDDEIEANSSAMQTYLFAIVAGFVLLIACVNFVNLATARATERSKEVGLRKVLGAYRSQLTRQFLGESVLLSVLAVLLSALLAEVGSPMLNTVAGQDIALDYVRNPILLVGLLGIGMLIGFVAGSYPALFLSRFQPVKVLQGRFKSGTRGAVSRKSLIVLQFAISMIMIAATMVIYKQLAFIQAKPLGFQREQILTSFNIFDRPHLIKDEIERHPNVVSVSLTSGVPAQWTNKLAFQFEGISERLIFDSYTVDLDFLETFGIELAQGRNFSHEFATDSSAFILNETAAARLGWPNPLGKQVELWHPTTRTKYDLVKRGPVIGVVKDFHFKSMHEEIRPMVLVIHKNLWNLSMRIRPDDMAGTLAFLESVWQRHKPHHVFQYTWVDEDFAAFYAAEQRAGHMFTYAAGLAVLIAAMGLFGLASYTAAQRTREMGIRKVLGASAAGLVVLLFREFGQLIGLAFGIAVPLGYLGMQRWLSNFAYATTLGWEVFALAGGAALLIAVLTVSYHALRSALANPVDSLRSE